MDNGGSIVNYYPIKRLAMPVTMLSCPTVSVYRMQQLVLDTSNAFDASKITNHHTSMIAATTYIRKSDDTIIYEILGRIYNGCFPSINGNMAYHVQNDVRGLLTYVRYMGCDIPLRIQNADRIRKIAATIDQNESWVLADMLEDIGCTDVEIMDKLRKPIELWKSITFDHLR